MADQDFSSLETAARGDEYSEHFHEVYEVVCTVEFVHNMRVYRIEILKRYPADFEDRFSSHVYRQENDQWQKFSVGWVRRHSVDSALAQTIGFLRDVTHPRR